MTWRALLASVKPAAPAAKASEPKPPDVSQTPEPATPPPPPVPENPARVLETNSSVIQKSTPPTTSPGGFELPLSPRSLAKEREETATEETIKDVISPPLKINPNSPEARWEPPSNGFLLHQNPRGAPVKSMWFIDESNQQPIATSPVKESQYKFFPEEPSSVDRRKARLLFSQDFIEGIQRLEEERKVLDPFDTDMNDSLEILTRRNICVFVRKRPMPERPNGDFDVLRALDDESSAPAVIVYNTEIKHDLRKKEVRPTIFGPLSCCFSDTCDSGVVYQRAAKSLVETAKSGGIATLLMFGQVRANRNYTGE